MAIQYREDTMNLESKSANVTEIKAWLVAYMAELTGMDADDIDANLPFDSYDLDSSAVVGMTVDLEDWLGRQLDPTSLYEYPTINTLANYLAKSVAL